MNGSDCPWFKSKDNLATEVTSNFCLFCRLQLSSLFGLRRHRRTEKHISGSGSFPDSFVPHITFLKPPKDAEDQLCSALTMLVTVTQAGSAPGLENESAFKADGVLCLISYYIIWIKDSRSNTLPHPDRLIAQTDRLRPKRSVCPHIRSIEEFPTRMKDVSRTRCVLLWRQGSD